MAAISADPFELEAMREEDGSWQPCHVSLSSSKASCGIIVFFESYAEEEIISNRKDVLRRLRFRSLPLQDGECFRIKEGECVLAMHKVQSRSFFFDAVIEKIYKVRHSNRVFCRCTFEIKWLNRELNGKCMTLSSKSIMKLSKKNISSHPVIDVFLTAFSPTNGVEVPPFLSLLEETSCDVDLHGLLEKQIEEISKLAEDESTDNILLGDKEGASGNRFTRSTRSRKKQEAEIETKKHLEDKPFLSPLAARAALASLMHEVPQKPDISIHPIEIEDYLNSTLKDPKNHIKEQSLDVSCILANFDASIQDNMLVASNPSQNTKIDSPVEAPSSASNRTASMKKNSQSTYGKRNAHAITPRITRSAAAVQKGILDSTAEVTHGSMNEKRGSPMYSRLAEGSMDLSVEDVDTPDKDEKKKKFISRPLEFPDTISPLDKRKRTRDFTAAIVNEEDQGKISQNNGSSPAMKKRAASLKKPELRFSPRLKFLPRTRSLKENSPTYRF